MSDDLRPRRSVLYMPAANARALEKAQSIPCDAIIFDLEDAVAPDAKDMARGQACAAVTSGRYGTRELTIRCNGLDTLWGAADVAAAAQAAPSAVVIPKVGNVEYLGRIDAALIAAGAPATTRIWAMVETPEAVFNVREIAAYPRVAALVMGTNDLAKELRAQQVKGRAPLLPHLATALLAARLAGKVILDGVYNDITNADGFAAEARQGRELGFDGKTLIHPSQVEPCNAAFAPSEAEVAEAQAIIAAFEEATAAGKGVVTVNGRMIENLHVDNSKRVLAIAASIADLG